MSIDSHLFRSLLIALPDDRADVPHVNVVISKWSHHIFLLRIMCQETTVVNDAFSFTPLTNAI
jgi:hypothetical protein